MRALGEDGDLVKEADAYGSGKHQADRHVEDEEGARHRLAWPWPFQDRRQSARGHGGPGPRPPRAGCPEGPCGGGLSLCGWRGPGWGGGPGGRAAALDTRPRCLELVLCERGSRECVLRQDDTIRKKSVWSQQEAMLGACESPAA